MAPAARQRRADLAEQGPGDPGAAVRRRERRETRPVREIKAIYFPGPAD